MAHSLEVRVPYLDRNVVEFAQRLNPNTEASGCTAAFASATYPIKFLSARNAAFAVNVVDNWFNSTLRGVLPEMLVGQQSLIFDLLKPEPIR
jgi:asparagine synthase (glutamine-hydrolysing)